MSSEKLGSAIAAIKSGDKATGSRILIELLKEGPSNESAWLWLATCMDDAGKKIYCLKKALSINPNNQVVIKALSKLELPPQPNLEDTQPTYLTNKIPSRDKPNPIEDKPIHVPEKFTSLDKDSLESTNIEESKALTMKKCPYCAEQIQKNAIVCRYCGRNLSDGQIQQPKVVTQYVPHKYQRKPKKRNWLITFLAALGFISLVCICASLLLSPLSLTTYQVTYKITGTATRASVTYENEEGGTEQGVVRIPWERSFIAKSGQFLYISAQNEGESGSVVCEIWVDGDKWRASISRGAYVISTCSGSAGDE